MSTAGANGLAACLQALRGGSGIRTTATVNFHTGKDIDEEHVNKCHLNAAVFDSNWERQAAAILDKHDKVRAWVKNDRLGLVIPYRKDGVARKYLPDFVVEMTDGSFLVVEIKGQEGDAAIKKAAVRAALPRASPVGETCR